MITENLWIFKQIFHVRILEMKNKPKTMFSISTPIISNLPMEEREKEGSHKQVEKKSNKSFPGPFPLTIVIYVSQLLKELAVMIHPHEESL